MTYWTLAIGGIEKSLADWGVSLPTRELRSHAYSTVKLTVAVPGADTAWQFTLGATATIYRNRTLTGGTYSGGTIFFYGMFVDTRDSETAADARHDYELRDPWTWLERITFRQSWYQMVGLSISEIQLSKLVLFVDINGNPINATSQITEILNYAIACGAPLQIGTIDPTIRPPYIGAASLTCAEALKRVLRCTPDCVTYFDYTTTPPTLHIRQRTNFSTVNIGLASQTLEHLDITPLYSQQVPSVLIEYDTSGVIDGGSYYQPSIDKYPGTATGTELGALVANVDIKGVSGTNVRQVVNSFNLFAPGLDTDDALQFWTSHDANLDKLLNPPDAATVYGDNAKIKVGSLRIALETVVQPTPPSTALPTLQWVPATLASNKSDIADRATFPNELINGAICPWMANNFRREQISVNITFDLFSTASGANVKVGSQEYTCSVVIETTNAGSGDNTDKIYTTFQASSVAEPIPSGLAQYFYNCLNVLYWRGEVDLTEQEVGNNTFMGKVLNLTGGTGKYAAINAAVAGVKENMEQGKTTISFGPPPHLSPNELVDLLWTWRNRRIGDWYGRKTGYIGGGNTELAKKTSATRASGCKDVGKSSFTLVEGDDTSSISGGVNNSHSQVGSDPNNGQRWSQWVDPTTIGS